MFELQDVLLKAMAKRITWWEAAEIIGVTDETMRRQRERLEEHGSTVWRIGAGAGPMFCGLSRMRRDPPSRAEHPCEILGPMLQSHLGPHRPVPGRWRLPAALPSADCRLTRLYGRQLRMYCIPPNLFSQFPPGSISASHATRQQPDRMRGALLRLYFSR